MLYNLLADAIAAVVIALCLATMLAGAFICSLAFM